MDDLMTDITEIVGNLTSRFIDELTRIIAAKDATIETLRARVQELAAEVYVSGNNIEQLRAEVVDLERLRLVGFAIPADDKQSRQTVGEAMTEIETLRAENRELRFRVLNPNVVINDVTNEPTWRSSD